MRPTPYCAALAVSRLAHGMVHTWSRPSRLGSRLGTQTSPSFFNVATLKKWERPGYEARSRRARTVTSTGDSGGPCLAIETRNESSLCYLWSSLIMLCMAQLALSAGDWGLFSLVPRLWLCGGGKESLVHTACACAKFPENSMDLHTLRIPPCLMT